MVDETVVKEKKAIGISSIKIYHSTDLLITEIPGSDLADFEVIQDNVIAVKTMNGNIELYSNCSFCISGKGKNCKWLRDRYFPENNEE